MKKILAVILITFSVTTFGQSVQTLQAEGKNFKEICDFMNLKFQNNSFKKGDVNFSREYMQFKRWEFYWKNNLMPDGEFPSSKELEEGYIQALNIKSSRSTNASN